MISDIALLIHSYLSKNFASDFLICGLPYAGIPYAGAVSILYHIPNIILRKEKIPANLQSETLKNLISISYEWS